MNKKFNVFVIEYGIHFTCETELKKKFTSTNESITPEINSIFNIKPMNILYIFSGKLRQDSRHLPINISYMMTPRDHQSQLLV